MGYWWKEPELEHPMVQLRCWDKHQEWAHSTVEVCKLRRRRVYRRSPPVLGLKPRRVWGHRMHGPLEWVQNSVQPMRVFVKSVVGMSSLLRRPVSVNRPQRHRSPNLRHYRHQSRDPCRMEFWHLSSMQVFGRLQLLRSSRCHRK